MSESISLHAWSHIRIYLHMTADTKLEAERDRRMVNSGKCACDARHSTSTPNMTALCRFIKATKFNIDHILAVLVVFFVL